MTTETNNQPKYPPEVRAKLATMPAAVLTLTFRPLGEDVTGAEHSITFQPKFTQSYMVDTYQEAIHFAREELQNIRKRGYIEYAGARREKHGVLGPTLEGFFGVPWHEITGWFIALVPSEYAENTNTIELKRRAE